MDEKDEVEGWYLQQRAIERAEIEALAEQVKPPCGFVLNGYAQSYPCQMDAHDPSQAHDCGPLRVVAPLLPLRRAG